MTTFHSFDEIGADAWDRVVLASPDGWAYCTSQWRQVILGVERWGLADFSFGAREGGRVVGVMPLQYHAASARMASTGWSAGGPVMAGDLAGDGRTRVMRLLIDHADALARQCGATSLEITLAPLRAASLQAPWGVNPLVAFGFDDVSTHTRVANLRQPEDALWMALSSNARQMVKKAERAGYRAVCGEWDAYVDEYYRVHTETYTRTGVPPHPRAYFDGLAQRMAPAGLAALWVGLDPSGAPVAFHNDTRFAAASVYHTGCSETAHLESGINYLLFWAAMRGARAAGCDWYELGEVFPDATEGKSRGLTVFKSKFGGELHRYFRARRPVPPAAPAGDPAAAQPQDAAAPIERGASAAAPDDAVRAAFAQGSVYETTRICGRAERDGPEYAGRLLQDRLDLVAELNAGGVLVDLCCASGAHLLDASRANRRAIGIDFTTRYVEAGRAAAAAEGRPNVAFIQADARRLPLASGTVDLLYCFSALYTIPRQAEAVAEIARVLRPGAFAVLDFGNRRSLNAYCARHYPDLTPLHPITVRQIRTVVRDAKLSVIRHRRYQLLPLWADRPRWLWPLLDPRWKSLMKRRMAGRMLDEWLSSLPVLRSFAFRHVLVCRKPGEGEAS